jgi:hypothetical protein
LLLAHGADLHARSDNSATAIEAARAMVAQESVALLSNRLVIRFRVCLDSMKCIYILFFTRTSQDDSFVIERRNMDESNSCYWTGKAIQDSGRLLMRM